MRCPKCQHIAHDDGAACPNCGHDLTLVLDFDGTTALDLTAEAEPLGPLGDFSLDDPVTAPLTAGPVTPVPQITSRAVRSGLPLFPFPLELGGAATAPRVGASRPLSVRRPTPEIPKLRTQTLRPTPAAGSLAFDGDECGADAGRTEPSTGDATARLLARRAGAGLLDALLLLGVDAAVVYLTLRLTGLPASAPGRLPAVPLATFLVLLDVGYVVSLTALGGQTIGKMAAGLRVVTEAGTPVTLVQSMKRTTAYAISVLPVGLGFVGLLFAKRRALHDLLAHTRVVKLS